MTGLHFGDFGRCNRWFGVGSTRDSRDSLDRRRLTISLEPIDAKTALELYLADKKNELSEASLKGHKYRLGHFVRWSNEQEIENLNTLNGRQLHRYRLWRREDADLNKVSEKTQMDTLRVFIRWLESIDGVEQDLTQKVLSPSVNPDENSRDVMLDSSLALVFVDLQTSTRSLAATHIPVQISSGSSIFKYITRTQSQVIPMTEDLKEPQIQDVAGVLSNKYTKTQLTNILKRFDAEDLESGGSSKKRRIINWLRNENESGEARPILAYMVENATFRRDELEDLERAFAGSRFALTEGESGIELWLKISATAERQVETHRSFVEDNAPDETLEKLEDAREELTVGDFEDAMEDLRKALEKMVDDNYHNGLNELVSKGLIHNGTGNQRNDKEMLYMPYGYCSSVGSHTSAGAPTASQLQAETGLILVEEAIYFVLRTIEEADQKGINLNEWEL